MSSQLKLFIDGVEVKRGVSLEKEGKIITFDQVSNAGYLTDSLGNQRSVDGWKIHKTTKKYASAIYVKRDENGEVLFVENSREMFISKPKSLDTNLKIYWPSSDYTNDYGFFILPE